MRIWIIAAVAAVAIASVATVAAAKPARQHTDNATATPSALVSQLATIRAATAKSKQSGQPIVSTQPTIVHPNRKAIVIVRGYAHLTRLWVRIAGATDNENVPDTWAPLHHSGAIWTGRLSRSKLPGIYLIQLRAGPADPIIRSQRWLLRVLPIGTLSRRSYSTPLAVVRWWVRTVAQGTVDAVRRWQPVTWDHRDPLLHQVFVVAYSPPGKPAVGDRLGMFVTAVRNGFTGHWLFLEATIVPGR